MVVLAPVAAAPPVAAAAATAAAVVAVVFEVADSRWSRASGRARNRCSGKPSTGSVPVCFITKVHGC